VPPPLLGIIRGGRQEFCMLDLARQEISTAATSIIVKVGTRVHTDGSGALDQSRITDLALQLNKLIEQGRRVVLVSSGAVGAGLNRLGLTQRPTDLAQLQAVAAIGQTHLIESYDRNFRTHGRHAAQILLSADDLNDRTRYLNVRNTLLKLLDLGAVPIINENDSVTTDELAVTFGDNDRLAAMVTNLLRAPLLVILSDVEGLYDGDPQHPASRVIPTVTTFDDTVLGHVRDQVSGLSKGGMASKLNAARIATMAGENVIIAGGRVPNVLPRITAGENIGTLFLAQGKSISPFKRWIGFSAQPKGTITVDTGARSAVVDRGRSLLPIGVKQVAGEFEKGDVVSICCERGKEFARGLTNYSATEAARISGLPSGQIAQVLGHRPHEEMVHRDNMVVLRS